MAWFVRLWPDECDSVTVSVNNEYFRQWFKADGERTYRLPERFQGSDTVKVGASVSPERKNGKMEVKWDGTVVQRYDWDNYEDHDCHKPSSQPREPREPRDHGGRGGSLSPRSLDRNRMTSEFDGGDLDPSFTGKAISQTTRKITNPQVNSRVALFSSGVLRNTSAGPPEVGSGVPLVMPIRRGEQILMLSAADMATVQDASSETKTFRQWEFLPWVLRSRDGVDLAQLDLLTVTVVRATDPSTGGYTVYGTLGFRQDSHGWQPPSRGLTVRVVFQDSRYGVLEDWVATTRHIIACSDAGEYKTFRQTLMPDWYDSLAAATIYIAPATWYRCR